MSRRWFLAFSATAIILGLAGFLFLTRPGKAALTASLLALEVLPDAPIRPLSTFSSAAERQEVSFPFRQTEGQSYLYRPSAPGRYGAVVMFLGVGPDIENPDLQRIAQGLARAGIASLIVKPAGISLDRLDPDQVELARSAFEFLAAQPFVDPKRVGMVGYCTGASIVILAAAEDSIRDRVAMVHALGPYFDAKEWMGSMLSGIAVQGIDGWVPDEVTVGRIRQHLVETVETTDQEAIQKALEQGTEPEELSAKGWAIYRLLKAKGPDETAARLNELPAEISEGLDQLSPRQVIAKVKAKTYVMHDQADPVIPVGESRKLVAALPQEALGHYTEFVLFEHAHATKALDWLSFLGEIWKLFTHLRVTLEEVI